MDLPKTIKESKQYPGMYHLVWEDGVISEDIYNLSRAKDLLFERVENVEFNKRAP